VPYLFDTDAISEVLRSKPAPAYLRWLRRVPREDQFTSAVALGELYKGAFRSAATAKHLRNIDERVLPELTVLPYDQDVARIFGQVQAELEDTGLVLADADAQIAATAIHHDLELVTGNVKHFKRIATLRISLALADARPQGHGS
jgi:predicted nucleic acid-binding protein